MRAESGGVTVPLLFVAGSEVITPLDERAHDRSLR